MLGYQNNVLRVDLSRKECKAEPLNMNWAEKYIGSKGLAIKYLYEELKPGIDPLSSENKLIFMNGPMTGTTVPCSGKLAIAGKSPATGTICDCSIGGHSALNIKYAGYDAIILEGALDKPGYLLIENDKVSFEDASSLWGKGSHDAETALIEQYGHDYSVLSIGPAGETLCTMACINSDYYRQAGRGGMGAVMGSKNLKAIVVRGTGGVKIPNIVEATKRIAEIERENTLLEDNTFVFDFGTTAFLEACQDGGILPKNNFSDATDIDWTKYNGDVLLEHLQGKRGCGSCGLGCGNFLKIGDVVCEGPEYESIAVAGPNAGNSDPVAIVKANQVADNMGLDTISAGDTIIWAMEMTERGVHDFGIRFGEMDKYIEYLELMARKEGVGAELCLGVKKLAKKYGGEDYALEVKGLEYPQYEPRGSWGMSLAYAVSDRGACHMRAYAPNEEVFAASIPPYTAEGKGEMVFRLGQSNAVKFSLCICDFWATLDYEIMAELMTLVTGREWTADDMADVGTRVLNIARAFNQREGFSAKDDTIPRRIVNEALSTGAAAGQKIPMEAFEDMKQQYYAVLGWNADGTLPESLLATL
ncbi:MAG: aldehyde ferredoxin oxidoreductase [Firmicutes bacterium HGW-Firmicutes-11]|jgi:aldehyde:ferredoxin oxidoreductase|nr:MAG: aldehyde ferredoxin oxidoreductase [Firmicutes bacterium HGW-Firmicutes-11]